MDAARDDSCCICDSGTIGAHRCLRSTPTGFCAISTRLREIGKYKTGVHRPTFSPQDVEARHWLVARLTEAGLDASIDGIGNVYGLDPRPAANC